MSRPAEHPQPARAVGAPPRPRAISLSRPVEVLSPGLLRTARLEIRMLRAADRAAFLDGVNATRAQLDRWSPLHRPGETDSELFDRQLEMARQGESRGTAWRRVAFLEDGRFVGCFNINAIARGLAFSGDANWWVAGPLAGIGLASEGVAAMLDVALDDLPRGLGLHRVSALIAPDNAPSIGVAHRAGMTRTTEPPVPLEHAGRVTLHDVYARSITL